MLEDGMLMAADIVLVRLLVSLLLGAIIGAEREWNHHAAGLKTNALVSLGASVFVIFGGAVEGSDSVARVGAQVVTGIGFLGGGIILREGLNIRGLNTAATLWCSAGVGVLANRHDSEENRGRDDVCFAALTGRR